MIPVVIIAMRPITTFPVSSSLYRVCGIQLCSQRGFMLNGFETRHRDQNQKSKPVLSQQKLWLTGLMILKRIANIENLVMKQLVINYFRLNFGEVKARIPNLRIWLEHNLISRENFKKRTNKKNTTWIHMVA